MTRKKIGRTAFLVRLTALVAIVVAVWLLLEALFNPWARSLTGGPTLTGEWRGNLVTPSGRRMAMWLLIRHDSPVRACADCPQIAGRIRTCEPGGERREYRVWGDVENWRGTAFLLKTLDEQEHAGKLTLGTLQGSWSGDVLDLTTELRVPGETVSMRFERDASGVETLRAIGGDPDTHEPIHWRMHRGTEAAFEADCR